MAALRKNQSLRQSGVPRLVPEKGVSFSVGASDPWIDLAPARHRYAEQECNEQARERRFPRDGADGG
jgi:hypothetical protein